jgi:hypothetical protein
MKKTLVAVVLVVAAVAFGQTPQAQPAAPQQPATGATPAPAGQPAPAQQKKEIKDPAEYNAYVGAVQQQDPNAKISGLEAFLQTYPNSVMKEDALELLMAAYEQAGNGAKMQETANRVLQANPNNLRALALLAFNARRAAEAGQNPQQNLAQGAQYAERGLQALQTAPKPEGMSDADFQKLKTQTSVIFNGVAGMNALQTKNFQVAQERLQAAVDAAPNDLRDVYPLALAYLTAPKPEDVKGLWYIARAANLAAGSPAQAQIQAFGKSRYTKYHGSDQGWDELLAQAKASPAMPAGFTIAAAPPPPTPAQQAADLVAKKEVKDMSFAEWELILSSGNQEAADKVWNTIKGVPLAIEGQVISATPRKLELAASVDDIEQKRTDVILNMAAALSAVHMPKPAATVQFEGTPVSYEPNPFVLTMEKGTLLIKGAPAHKTTPRRRTPRSQ